MEKKDFIPLVSTQHGATITLCVSSLIPVFLSVSLSPAQLLTFVFLFSGFMCVEILQGRMKRGRWKSVREKYWNFAYGGLSVFGGGFLFLYNPLFIKVLPLLILIGALCVVLLVFRLDRLIFSQFILFSLFALSGLLTFPVDNVPGTRTLLVLWAVESLYFGLSTFTVKYRMGGIGAVPIFIYLGVSLVLVFFILPGGVFRTLFTLFLSGKIILPVLLGERFKRVRLKKIGLFEFASSLFFLCITGFLFTPA